MHSLGDISKALNRSVLYLSGLQARFELPVMEKSDYSAAYLECLRTLVMLRTFNVAEKDLVTLWELEKKLLVLLHLDSSGSRTWFLDSCGVTAHIDRRLLLTNQDLGISLNRDQVQMGLNFSDSLPELFAGKEMGEDALRVLRECLTLRHRILAQVDSELANLRFALKWAKAVGVKT